MRLLQGDITRANVDAIVNAANSALLGGGGVDGAIHRAAGPQLLEACRALPEVSPGVRCPTGLARITPGFKLSAQYVIHTVGPIYDETVAAHCEEQLVNAYANSLLIARAYGLRSIAFPAISCGVYRFPAQDAARLALTVCRSQAQDLQVEFWLFDPRMLESWQQILQQL